MIFHLTGSHLAALMADNSKPDVLKQRELEQYDKLAADHGIRFVAFDNDRTEAQATVHESTPEKLFAYTDAIGCQALSVEIADLAMWSRGVESFALQQFFRGKPNTLAEAESRDSLKASLRGLPVDQVHDCVSRVLVNAMIAPPQTNLTEEEMVKDLEAAGYLVPSGFHEPKADHPTVGSDSGIMRGWENDIPQRKPRPGQDPSDWMTYSD